jgi:hypothetical protein
MKILTTYSKNKHDFQLLHREGDLAIFKGKNRATGVVNWEIIKIQRHNGLTMAGVFMEAAEFAPSNEQWGRKGWTADNEQNAWRIFNSKKQIAE